MVGIAVATMVWSRAPRNIASMIPNTMRRISACDSGLCPAQWLWAWGARLGFLGDAVLAEFISGILGQLVSWALHRPQRRGLQGSRRQGSYSPGFPQCGGTCGGATPPGPFGLPKPPL